MKSVFTIFSLFLYSTLFSLSIQNILEEDKIYISIGSEEFLINLFESSVTEELISLLPQKTKLEEEENNQKILSLKVKIETDNFVSSEKLSNEANKANKGDLFLYKGTKIVLITEPKVFGENKQDVIKIGHTTQINEIIGAMEKNRSKTFYLWNTLNYAEHKGKIKPYASSLMNCSLKVLTFFCFLFL